MASELEIRSYLIDDYYYNLEVYKSAKKEGASATAELVKRKLESIKLKLQPLELPNENEI